MNPWVQKSIRLAETRNYLDQLHRIYPVSSLGLMRPAQEASRQRITDLFNNRNHAELIRELLRQGRFPYQEPYVGFLRVDPDALNRNPETAQRIAQKLHTIGMDRILEGIEEPPQSSRQMGQFFRNFVGTLPYARVSASELEAAQGISILEGGDADLKAFALRVLRCRVSKGLDLVAKTPRGYVIGEAKFISVSGGSQNNSFREVVRFVRGGSGRCVRVGILDGVAWVHRTGLFSSIRREAHIFLSALLLRDFLESQR